MWQNPPYKPPVHRATSRRAGSSTSLLALAVFVAKRRKGDVMLEPFSNIQVSRHAGFFADVQVCCGQAAVRRGHTKEGSFINRSLLALGSVIAKLSEGNAAHVPFRDSKLTRVLASSLTGSGARIAVVCTVTPASSHAEETHNTLKFAMRAKKVRRVCVYAFGVLWCPSVPFLVWTCALRLPA